MNSKDVFGAYRSKTPTADIYSTQQKEILPSRPKTPLVDTRPVMKTPLGEMSISSTSSSKSLRRSEMNEMLNYEFLPENPICAPYDNSELSCSQTDINVNMNDRIYKPLYNYDNSVYDHYIPHMDTCYCYDCKQTKLGLVNDIRMMNIDGAYESKYVNKNMDVHPKEMVHPKMENWQPVDHVDAVDYLVTLVRHETGFGFRIVGGTEEGSQVAVGHIVPGGAADLDGRINTGDEILSVDGHSVLKASHHQVVQLMQGAAMRGRVTLLLRRRPPQQMTSCYDVTVTRSENEGFGFVIISSANKAGSTIGKAITIRVCLKLLVSIECNSMKKRAER